MKAGKFVVFLYLLFIFSGCKKNTAFDLHPNLNVANDIVIAEGIYIYSFNMILKALSDTSLLLHHNALIDSANVTLDTSGNKLYFNYSGIVGADNVKRSGKVEVEFYGPFLQEGSSIHIHFMNYWEDNQNITGLDSIVNKGKDEYNNWLFENYVTNGFITRYNQGVIHWTGLNSFFLDASSFYAGSKEIQCFIRGRASVVSSKGYLFSAEITDSLVDQLNCPWLRSGRIAVYIPGVDVQEGLIDYNSDEDCSDKIQYNFDGNILNIRKNQKYFRE